MESSSTPPATQPATHPVNVSVNPLQLLWLQESGIDRLWGRPLVASHGDVAVAGHAHAAGSHAAINSGVASGASATGPAAAGVAAVTPEAPSTGAAKEPPAPPSTPTTTEPSPARQALAKLRQQMERQRGKSGGRISSSNRLSQAGSGERASASMSAQPSSGASAADDGSQADQAALTQLSAVEGLVYEKMTDAAADTQQARHTESDWPVLSKTIQQCTQCGLSEHARQPVPGTGPADAALMIIDQAPGAQDDASGEPLSGQAGTLLDNMLKAIGLARESVFITDVVKCRPMVGRSPEPQELDACADYLQQQIALVQPRCVLLLGNAAQSVLGTTRPVGELRETPELHISVQGRNIPVVVTFHPNHLMANQAAKSLAWHDLKRLRKILEQG